MSIHIFTMTHKKFEVPNDTMYQPLQVGSALQEDLGYWRDDRGDNISKLNCYYSELTGIYWIWKNYKKDDYIGTCHYRRYLMNEKEKIMTQIEYETLLRQYDLITTRRVQLNNSYHYGFSANHNVLALDTTGEVIREFYPEYEEEFVTLVNSNETYFGNIFVTSHSLFDEYAEWLFSIFFEVEKRMNLETDEDEYHKRVFGFISEFLLLVFVRTKKLKVYECKVGMIGEKAETKEVKEKLAQYFRNQDIAGAKTYFLEMKKKRPDILMEASDITGELRLAMQMIATAEHEEIFEQKTFLKKETDFRKLVEQFNRLNQIARRYTQGQVQKEDFNFLKKQEISKQAIYVAIRMLGKDAQWAGESADTLWKQANRTISNAPQGEKNGTGNEKSSFSGKEK